MSNKLLFDSIEATQLEIIETETNYSKVLSSNTSRLEANEGFFILLMKGIFDPYLL